jgi:multiple sugar transport system permease protein
MAVPTAGRAATPPPTATDPAPARPAVSRIARDRMRTGLIFATPTGLVVAIVFLVPLGLLIWMSLNRWPLIGASAPNWGVNYAAVTDPLFLNAAWFTLKYTVITTIVLSAVAFGLALLVQESRRGTALYRTAFFLPAAVGVASTSLLFYGLYTETDGPLNSLLGDLGLGPVGWISTPTAALWSTVLLVIWRFSGFYMLILLTGLQSIPDEVYEAARVDGASWWRTFISITLPLLRPSIALMMILSVTGSILAFDQFYVLTSGGPDNSTITLVVALYRKAFIQFDLGTAAALSMIVLAVLLLLNIVQFALLRRDNTA